MFFVKKLKVRNTYFDDGRINSAFFLPNLLYKYLMNEKKKIKNIKISPESHEILVKYCQKNGFKIYKFLENLIQEKCKIKKDLYGEN